LSFAHKNVEGEENDIRFARCILESVEARKASVVERNQFTIESSIRGNRVIGATDDKQMSVPVLPSTLACDAENGLRIRPEHLHLALRQYAGISEHKLSEQFPLVIPEKERLVKLWG